MKMKIEYIEYIKIYRTQLKHTRGTFVAVKVHIRKEEDSNKKSKFLHKELRKIKAK